jgi:hypothetical protein
VQGAGGAEGGRKKDPRDFALWCVCMYVNLYASQWTSMIQETRGDVGSNPQEARQARGADVGLSVGPWEAGVSRLASDRRRACVSCAVVW